jgi:hypothetical protein
MVLFRSMKSGDVMRIGDVCRVKFKFCEGRGDDKRAILLVDYGDDGEVDEVEVSASEWFDLQSREYVMLDQLAPEVVACGIHDRNKCARVTAQIGFAGPRSVRMYPEAF